MQKTELQIMESMKKDLLTIKLKLDNPTSTQPLENYADKVKTNRNETQTKCTTDIRSLSGESVALLQVSQCFAANEADPFRVLLFSSQLREPICHCLC